MKKLKATLFLICGLGTAMFLSSCLGDNDNSNDYFKLSQGLRSSYYTQITEHGTYNGLLLRDFINAPTDTLGPIQWYVNELPQDTTIDVEFPVKVLAKYITDISDENKAILDNESTIKLKMEYRAPYSELKSMYDNGYYRFIYYVKNKSVISDDKKVEINYSLTDPGTTDDNGDLAYFFSSQQSIVVYKEQYDQIIDFESIKIGDKTYPLKDDESNDNAAHFEILYSTGDNN